MRTLKRSRRTTNASPHAACSAKTSGGGDLRQFEVYRNPSNATRSYAPFVVVLQSHHLSLASVLVAPMVNDKIASSVEIAVDFEGQSLVLAITEMGSVLVASLREAIGDVFDLEDDIRRSLDRLFTGF